MSVTPLPPHVGPDDKVILFDGVCKLCNFWSGFIIAHDKQRIFKLCSVQSKEGGDLLQYFGFPTDVYETMLYVEGHRCYQQSDAFFRVISQLGYPWKMACWFKVFPKRFCNWVYDRIALNRYRWFGRYDQCVLPLLDHESRFLKSQK